MIRQYRQGDVLLCAVDEIPLTAMPAPMMALGLSWHSAN